MSHPENFCLFLSLLDRDVYGNIKSLEEAMANRERPFYLRGLKEALVTFPDPDTGKPKMLFTKRIVQTTPFVHKEKELVPEPVHTCVPNPDGSAKRESKVVVPVG